jgi:hypothetical protein
MAHKNENFRPKPPWNRRSKHLLGSFHFLLDRFEFKSLHSGHFANTAGFAHRFAQLILRTVGGALGEGRNTHCITHYSIYYKKKLWALLLTTCVVSF